MKKTDATPKLDLSVKPADKRSKVFVTPSMAFNKA